MGATSTKTQHRSKGAIDLGRRSVSNAKLLHLDSDSLLRHTSLAYEDGYADGREFGINGKFVPDYYSNEERVRYLVGFAAGVRVHDTRKEKFGF